MVFGVARGLEDLHDRVVAQHVRDAVGHEHEAVPVGDVEAAHRDAQVVLHAERARDDVARQARRGGVVEVRRELEHVASERVIFAELLEVAAAHAEARGVTDAREVRQAVLELERERDDRGAHAAIAVVALGDLEDLAVGAVHRAREATRAREHTETVDELTLGVATRGLEFSRERGERHARGDVARVVPTGTIGDGEEAEVGAHQDRVLVVRAPSDVLLSEGADLEVGREARGHRVDLTKTRSRRGVPLDVNARCDSPG